MGLLNKIFGKKEEPTPAKQAETPPKAPELTTLQLNNGAAVAAPNYCYSWYKKLCSRPFRNTIAETRPSSIMT